ncbi:MAG: glucose-6-phosphate isomerase [Peptococcaceae bacterium]|nr:glucose-6-phosphate isomerase [Peptococcaceae bacterium]
MKQANHNEWQRFKEYLYNHEELGLQLDISKINFSQADFNNVDRRMQTVFSKMMELEGGAIANPDENRMVGHYWLRSPELAPRSEITEGIRMTLHAIKEFATKIHQGLILGEIGREFKNVLVIGIGGSSLGPRFASDALGSPGDRMKLHFLDNTDPDGMDRVFDELQGKLDMTLTVVISKSGGTVETRNGMEEARRLYHAQGLQFARHAVSITQSGSQLDRTRIKEGWLMAFPMWDWIGGRTSLLSAVGLLPLALQGINIDQLLEGAKKCDEITRSQDTRNNPSALLALMWFIITGGLGGKLMVMLPYKDRLELFTKYLQQLIMESLGKETDLEGKVVKQGIAVMGNKGSTDQHSYLQQLLDGPENVFVTFIEVLKDRNYPSDLIAEESTSGDYLHAFFIGTRKALSQRGKDSITITIKEINEFSIGVLLALFERTVGFYALLSNINAYHQPAVELGKKVAGEVISLKNKATTYLHNHKGQKYTLEELSAALAEETNMETLFKILQHVVHNPDHGIKREMTKSSQEDTENNFRDEWTKAYYFAE